MRKIIIVALFWIIAQGLYAKDQLISSSGEVWLGNELVMRVSHDAGEKITERIESALLKGVSPSQVLVKKQRGVYTLYGGKTPIVTVTPSRAKLDGTSPKALASLWAKRLQQALARGQYLIAPLHVVVPVGQTRSFSIKGRYKETPQVNIGNSNVCSLISGGALYELKGLRPGVTLLDISSGSLKRQTEVIVKEVAGYIPREVPVIVTGREVSYDFLKRTIPEALMQQIEKKPDAKLSYTIPYEQLPKVLLEGDKLNLLVPVKLSGEGYLSTQGKIALRLETESFKIPTADYLMLSNNPENFNKPGILFKESFPEGKAARVFFHHHNNGTSSYRFVLEASNLGKHDLQIHVLEGMGGPVNDELHVGEIATDNFFRAYQENLGKIITLHPQSSYNLVFTRVPPKATLTGVLQVTSLGDEKPYIEAKIESMSGKMLSDDLEDENRKVKGLFANPYVDVTSQYEVGKDYAFVSIGKRALLTEKETSQPNLGNYGVIYTVHLIVKNPLDQPNVAHVMFKPQAGPAGGIFLIDNKRLIRTPIVSPFASYSLLKLDLQPHETRNITIQTMPLGGSFYPVDLVVQP